jgi:hypothetical protein
LEDVGRGPLRLSFTEIAFDSLMTKDNVVLELIKELAVN